MASTFTTGFGIEKIGSGEQDGAWGTTTNHNLDILDRIASYKAVAITTNADTATLTVREASPGAGTENLQDGMYRVIKFTGALDSACTITIAPNTAPAWFIIENATSGSQSLILTQGSGANVTVQNGKNVIIYCDGAGGGAAVVNALSDLQIATLEVTGAAAIDGALTLGGAVTGATNITLSGELDAATLDISGNADIDGTTNLDAVDIDGAVQIDATLSVGVDDTGYDVKFFGATSGAHMLWDESADDLKLVGAAGLTVAGNIDVDGTTNLDAVDIDGAVQIDATLSVGVDDTGYDVKFFGATASRYLLWDESADSLIFTDTTKSVFGTDSDAEIYHDGSNMYFKNDTGNTLAYSDTFQFFSHTGSELFAQLNHNSAVKLYFDSELKFETTATGVTVTGGTTSVGTGGVTIDATAAADANPELELTAVARQFNTGVGGATFATTALRGSYYIYDATATAYRFSINSSGLVGIGTTAPSEILHIVDGGGSDAEIILETSTDSTGSRIHLKSPNQTGSRYHTISSEYASTANWRIGGTGTDNAFDFAIGSGLTNVMRINATGVGIGTTAPTAEMHIKGAAPEIVIQDGASDTFTSGAVSSSLRFQARNSSVRDLAQIDAVHESTNGTIGAMRFQTRHGDVLAERVRISSDGKVGIGTAAPNTKIDVIGASTGGTGAVDTIRLRHTGTSVNDGPRLQFTSGTSTSGAAIASQGKALNSADLLFYAGGNTERMRIDRNGNLTIPNQPAFLVHPSARINDVTGDGTAYTAVWNTEIFDQGGDFASNTFTAPVTGKYQFNVNISLLGIVSGHTTCIITLVTSNRSIRTHFKANVFAQTGSGDQNSFNGSVLTDMDASDTAHVTIAVAGGSKVVDFDGDANYASAFSGSLIA